MAHNAGHVGNAGQQPEEYVPPGATSEAGSSRTAGLFGLDADIASTKVTIGTFTSPSRWSDNFGLRAGDPTPSRETIVKALAKLGGYDQAELQALQEQLFTAGYYGKTKRNDIAWGRADSLTYHAFLGVLIDTARANLTDQSVTPDDILADRATSGVETSVGGATITVPNAEETYQIVQRAAQELIGKKMEEGQARRVAANYIASYTAAAQNVDAVGETGGVATAPQSLASFVESAVDPNEAAAHNLASGVFAAFASTIDGIGD